jgi:hypothetical protein
MLTLAGYVPLAVALGLGPVGIMLGLVSSALRRNDLMAFGQACLLVAAGGGVLASWEGRDWIYGTGSAIVVVGAAWALRRIRRTPALRIELSASRNLPPAFVAGLRAASRQAGPPPRGL